MNNLFPSTGPRKSTDPPEDYWPSFSYDLVRLADSIVQNLVKHKHMNADNVETARVLVVKILTGELV